MSSRSRAKNKRPRHVCLYIWLMETAAWKSLDAVARAIYVEMSMRYFGSNNGTIVYGVRMAETALKIGRRTALRALGDLQDRGFIRAVTKGAFNMKVDRRATEWRLT
jgi:hypothetical protein